MPRLHSGLFPSQRMKLMLTSRDAAECTGTPRCPMLRRRSPMKETPRNTARPRTRTQLNRMPPVARPNHFPFNGFTCSFTLFSKCFSSFPHGTCSLSVSCRYLAFGGVYHPLWAAIPNNPTLGRRSVSAAEHQSSYGVLTLSDSVFQRT